MGPKISTLRFSYWSISWLNVLRRNSMSLTGLNEAGKTIYLSYLGERL